MELKKVQKQGRDEKTQEDYRTSAVYFCRCRVVFLRSFISALFLYFFSSIPTWNQVLQKRFFPSIHVYAVVEALWTVCAINNFVPTKQEGRGSAWATLKNLWIEKTISIYGHPLSFCIVEWHVTLKCVHQYLKQAWATNNPPIAFATLVWLIATVHSQKLKIFVISTSFYPLLHGNKYCPYWYRFIKWGTH